MTETEKGKEMLMEKTWENIQRKTFTGWVNSHVKKRNQVIQNLETDLSNGLKLISLLEIISDESFPFKFEKKPSLRIQQVGNVGYALQFIKQKGVNLAGIGAEEIVDGNLKMILGMIWTIILRFQIQDISMEDLSAKEALLLWCQKKTAGYKGVNVKNFHTSFQDGLAFCALIHKHRPDLLDYNALDHNNKYACLEKAFDVAEKHLDIPRLLDPNDLLDVPKPDERSVMTYVSLYYHVFSSSQKAEAAGKRVGKLIEFAEANDQIKNDYLNRAKRLADWINQTTQAQQDRDFGNSVEDVVQKIGELKSYQQQDKPPKYNEKVEVEAVINGLNTKLALNNRPSFVPPAGLSPADLDNLWRHLEQAEHDRSLALRDELRRQKKIQELVRRFLQLGGKLEAWSDDRLRVLQSQDYGDTISAVRAKLKNLEAFHSEYEAQSKRLDQLKQFVGELSNAHYSNLDQINARLNNISTKFGGLETAAATRKANLEAQLARLQQIENLLLDFAKRGLEFRVWLEHADELLTNPISVETVEAANELQAQFDAFVHERQSKEAEYNALIQLASDCRAAGVPEDTFAEVSLSGLSSAWENIGQLQETRRSHLASEIERQQVNEQLRVQFAEKANAFDEWHHTQSKAIESLSGDVNSQLDSLKSISSDISGGASNYQELVQLNNELERAHVADNPYTTLNIEALKTAYDSLSLLVKKKQQVLEKELLAQTHSGLSAEQLSEFKECFTHFDKDQDNLLNRLELGACLKALGEDISFEANSKLDNVLTSIDSDQDGKVTFDEFVKYMEQISTGSDTPDSIKFAFKTLAGDKEYVTEADLRAVLEPAKVDYCLKHMQPYPGVQGAYDYNTFTDKLYS